MNRRSFLSQLTLAIGAVALAPAIRLLSEPETPCTQGLLFNIQQNGNQVTYNSQFTLEDLKDLIEKIGANHDFSDEYVIYTSDKNFINKIDQQLRETFS